jgi:hypothetical protein
MQRSWRVWGSIAACALALGTTGCRRASGPGTEQAAARGEVQGVVSERRSDQLRVSDKSGEEHMIRADERTQVILGGQPTSGLGEVPEGAEIRATFPAGDASKPALRIEVLEAGKGGKPAPTQQPQQQPAQPQP